MQLAGLSLKSKLKQTKTATLVTFCSRPLTMKVMHFIAARLQKVTHLPIHLNGLVCTLAAIVAQTSRLTIYRTS